jgi:hypothetical protein
LGLIKHNTHQFTFAFVTALSKLFLRYLYNSNAYTKQELAMFPSKLTSYGDAGNAKILAVSISDYAEFVPIFPGKCYCSSEYCSVSPSPTQKLKKGPLSNTPKVGCAYLFTVIGF